MLLRTLGELRLEGGSGDLSGRRKDLALLAYLARKAPVAVSRAELASLLWEDRDEARGRQSLRQALLGLRRVVGDGLAADPDQARLEPGTVGLDVKEFERAVAEGRMADAVGWWNGEFLPGLEEGGGEALRIWLEVEREGLRRALALALDRLSSDSAKAADWDHAVEWSERWTRFLPGDERGHIRLVETLSLAGRPSEAQVRHSAFLARLRSELEREPSAELTALGRRLEREAARSSTPHRPGSAALFTPDLVGRGAALAELAAGWDAARSGHAVTVVVEGELGIGKSRLAEEFLRRQEPVGVAVVVSVSAAAAGSGSDALAAAVLGGLAAAPGLGAAAPETLSAIAARVPAVRQRFSNLPAPGSDVSLSAAAVEALAAVVEERAVVLVVDDLERSTVEGLAFLAALARARVPSVLTILAAAEDEGAAAGIAAAAGSRPRRLKLPPLTPAEVESLVASMLVLPATERHALATRIHEEAGGNPLYCIELIAALVDEGALVVGERGTWTLSHPERWSAPLSGNLRTMIARRTAGLAEEAHIVAETVARLGPSADEAALREAAGLSSERFDAGREELLGRRLLRTAAPPDRGYQFHHQLVRRAVLEDAGRRQRTAKETRGAAARGKRRRLLALGAVAALAISVGGVVAIRQLTVKPQLTAADRRQFVIAPVELPPASSPQDSAAARAFVAALERALSGRAVSPQAVAGHLARMRRTDTTAMGNRATARDVAIRAGARLLVVPALSHSANRLSLGYRLENTLSGETVLGREREMPPDASPSGPALSLAGSVARDAVTASRQVPPLDPLPNVTTSSIEALRAYAAGNRNLNTEGGAGVTMMRRAVALDSTFASAQAMLAYLLWFDFDQRAAERHAIAALRSLNGLGRPESLKTRLRIANAVEDWPTAVDCARAFIELDPRSAHAWGDLGQLLYFNRQYTAAIAAYDSARALSPASQSIFNLINRATVVARVNRFEEAVADYEAGFRIDSAMLRQPFVNHEYGVALYRLGREADARAAYRARLAGTPSDRAGAFRSLALMEAHGGRFERAAGLLDDAVAGSTAADDTLEAAIGQMLRAEVALTRGDTAAAAGALTSAEQLAQAKPLPYEIVSRTVKLLARANAVQRAASLLQLLQEQTKAVSLQARARLLVARGEVLLAQGRTREGRRDLDQALALDPIPETMESGAYAAGRTGDWTLAAQRYDSLAASGAIDWDGHMALELGRYQAGRAWEHAGRRDRARERYQQFLDGWPASTADSTLPALLDARYRIGGPPGDIAGP